jgi:plastocyanin
MVHLFITISAAFILLLTVPFNAFAGGITGEIAVKGLRSPANILVFVSKAPAFPGDVSTLKFVMDQQNLTFIPHILPVLVGSTVHFPNHDKVSHNVFSLSRTKKFNLGSYAAGTSKTVVFDKPGIVELRCDVHAEMSAYIMVMKNPYWAITNDQGHFEIPDTTFLAQQGFKRISGLPAGKYVIKTWHEKLKSIKKAVEVPEAGDVAVQLNLRRGTPGVLYK